MCVCVCTFMDIEGFTSVDIFVNVSHEKCGTYRKGNKLTHLNCNIIKMLNHLSRYNFTCFLKK